MTSGLLRRALIAGAALVLGASGAVVVAGPAAAATYPVTSNADAGAGTLREAVGFANANPGQDAVTIPAGMTITLASGLTLTEGVSIGTTSGNATITGTGGFDLFSIAPDAAKPAQAYTWDNLALLGTATGSAIVATTSVPFTSLQTNNCQFTSFTSTAGGAIYLAGADNGTVAFGSTNFTDNSAGLGSGGAVYVSSAASVTVSGNNAGVGVATGNTAGVGGAFTFEDIAGAVTIDNGAGFFDNSASTGGGGAVALFRISGSVIVTSASFGVGGSGNTASVAGGALMATGVGPVTITDSSFDSNESTNSYGGAVALEEVGEVSIQGSTFQRNIAAVGGGAVVVVEAPSVYVGDSEFGSVTAEDPGVYGNRAREGGGAIRLDGIYGAVDIVNSGFHYNEAEGDLDAGGGAVYATVTGSVAVAASIFVGNESTRGGAVALSDTIPTVEFVATDFIGNVATNGGGGAFYAALLPTSTIFDTVNLIENESRGAAGGAIRVDQFDSGTSLTIRDSSVIGNVTDGSDGGGLYLDTSNGVLEIDSSTFANNSVFGVADGNGSAIAVEQNSGTIRMLNTTVDELLTETPAIVVRFQGETGLLEILSSTLVSNDRALLVASQATGSRATAVNSIFSGVDGTAVVRMGDYPLQATASLFSSGFDPAYIAAEATNRFEIEDFRLGDLADNGGVTMTRLPLDGSPARDAGDTAAGYLATTPNDQRGDGFPRLLNGRIDIGAVEVPVRLLPVTGATVPVWIPVVGGVVLLLGAGALIFTVVSRRRLSAAEAPPQNTPPADPSTPPAPPISPTPPTPPTPPGSGS